MTLNRLSPCIHGFAALILLLLAPLFSAEWECQILPSEQHIEIDKDSGAKIIFATTNKASDTNFYFHDRCWLMDNQAMLFNSNRSGRNEIYAYLADSGELVRLNREQDAAAGSAVASRLGDRCYVLKNKSIFEWTFSLQIAPQTTFKITERKLCDIPKGATQLSGLNENSDATLVSFGYKIGDESIIAVVDVKTGVVREAARVPFPIGHIQFSWTRPDLLAVSRSYGSDTAPLDPNEPAHARFWFININTKTAIPAFYQVPGELVTHECWWLNDQMTFIGGHKPGEGHVKSLDLKTADIRIRGAGAWLPETSDSDLARVNWWHQSGSPDGRWLVADNWHGVISLFDAGTTRQHILTTGHRIYGKGAHPHAGWDLTGDSVEFTSNKRGNPDVCIGIIPESWKH